MVRGIATDNKKYKHKKRNDEKDMCEDMLVWRRYIQRDIDKLRNRNQKEISTSEKKDEKETISPVRVLQILILGILGPIILIGGVYMLINEINIVSVNLVLIGAVFVIALILNEIYREK